MKIKQMAAVRVGGSSKAVLVMDDMRGQQFGAALIPDGSVLVAYESEDGSPGPNVVKALREMADAIERGGNEVHDVTPIIPQAEA